MKWFQKKNNKISKFMITEEIIGNWHYHISYEDRFTKSLCRKDTMKTSIPLSTWGNNTEPTSARFSKCYCRECEKIFVKEIGKIIENKESLS